MKNRKLLFLFLFAICAFLTQLNAQIDTLSVKPLIPPQDSMPVSYEWQTRSPLTEQENQRRQDSRAEVEEMKRRFRAYHGQKEQEKESDKENEDYMWSSSEDKAINRDRNPARSQESIDAAKLKEEINKRFQQSVFNEKTDPSGLPESASYNTEKNWENDAFQDAPASNVDWQLSIGQKNEVPEMKLKQGDKIILHKIQFNPKSAVLTPAAKIELNTWLHLFRLHQRMKIEIGAHTNLDVPYTASLELSAQRARAIYSYLTSNGVPQNQMTFRGYGRLSPLFLPSDENNQQKNERIEVIILELPNG